MHWNSLPTFKLLPFLCWYKFRVFFRHIWFTLSSRFHSFICFYRGNFSILIFNILFLIDIIFFCGFTFFILAFLRFLQMSINIYKIFIAMFTSVYHSFLSQTRFSLWLLYCIGFCKWLRCVITYCLFVNIFF